MYLETDKEVDKIAGRMENLMFENSRETKESFRKLIGLKKALVIGVTLGFMPEEQARVALGIGRQTMLWLRKNGYVEERKPFGRQVYITTDSIINLVMNSNLLDEGERAFLMSNGVMMKANSSDPRIINIVMSKVADLQLEIAKLIDQVKQYTSEGEFQKTSA